EDDVHVALVLHVVRQVVLQGVLVEGDLDVAAVTDRVADGHRGVPVAALVTEAVVALLAGALAAGLALLGAGLTLGLGLGVLVVPVGVAVRGIGAAALALGLLGL